ALDPTGLVRHHTNTAVLARARRFAHAPRRLRSRLVHELDVAVAGQLEVKIGTAVGDKTDVAVAARRRRRRLRTGRLALGLLAGTGGAGEVEFLVNLDLVILDRQVEVEDLGCIRALFGLALASAAGGAFDLALARWRRSRGPAALTELQFRVTAAAT